MAVCGWGFGRVTAGFVGRVGRRLFARWLGGGFVLLGRTIHGKLLKS